MKKVCLVCCLLFMFIIQSFSFADVTPLKDSNTAGTSVTPENDPNYKIDFSSKITKAEITIKNTSDKVIKDWELSWIFKRSEKISSMSNGEYVQNGKNVTVKPNELNNEIAPGDSVKLGFNAKSKISKPTDLKLKYTLVNNEETTENQGSEAKLVDNEESVENQGSEVKSEDLVNANSKFAFDLFKKINSAETGKNVFVSPFSVSTALSMLYQGARTDTRTEIADMLYYNGMDINSLNSQYKTFLNNLKNVDPEVTMNISNSIWSDNGFGSSSDFINVNKEIFGAEVKGCDFGSPDAPDIINEWISNATNGKVTDMIKKINSNVVMYLINAIYFKGAWKDPFDARQTEKAYFKKESGEANKINMMSGTKYLRYGNGSDYSAIKLPYGDKEDKVNMYCILPNSDIKIDDFISKLDADKFNSIKKSIANEDSVSIYMPKFKMECTRTLNSDLQALGMKRAFDQDAADLRGIAKDLYVSEVKQKAVLEVNEEGSEASAAAYVEISEKGWDPSTKVFELSRPFVFAIVDDTTGSVLFIGKAADLSMES